MKRGMVWYRILNVLLVIWAVYEPLSTIASLNEVANNYGMSLIEYIPLMPLSIFLLILIHVIGDTAIMLLIARNMSTYNALAYDYCRLLLSFSFFIAVCSLPIGLEVFGSYLGVFISRLIIFLPSYYYLKKRLYATRTLRTESQIRSIPPDNPQAVRPSVLSPFELIPVKLMGHTDQAERDRIIAECLQGHFDPYTGNPIVCEDDWNNYVHAYNADKESKIQSKQFYPKEYAAAGSKADEIISSVPKFCRFCGKSLRSDSEFCEHCGRKVR